MPALILVALKLIFIAFIYLFVWQIAKAVGAHLGIGRPAALARTGTELTVVKSDTQNGLRVNVRRPVILGRNEEADVVINDPYAAEFHIRLVSEAGVLSLFDLGSTTGTYVNGKRVVSPQEISGGDTVRIGKTVLEVT